MNPNKLADAISEASRGTTKAIDGVNESGSGFDVSTIIIIIVLAIIIALAIAGIKSIFKR